jgi:hypothetical protein
VHWAPGIPCALCFPGRTVFAKLGRIAPRECGGVFEIFHVIASEAKQSISPRKGRMDCFVASLLAMTVLATEPSLAV